MIPMTIILDGAGCWQDLQGRDVIHLAGGQAGQPGAPIQVAALEGGLVSGRPSVAFRFDLPDGRVVIAETTARLFVTAARAIAARYPDLFKDDA